MSVDCEIERYAVMDDGTESERAHATLTLTEETVIKIGRIGGVLEVTGDLLALFDAGKLDAEDVALIALGERAMPGFA